MRLALAQINPTVGDLDGNSQLIAECCALAAERRADLVVFPELCLCGYPPKDLLLHEDFVAAHAERAEALGGACSKGMTLVLGVPMRGPAGGITNSLLAFRDGVRVARYDKRLLPTYDVFDENRYFIPGRVPVVLEIGGLRIGLAICEDLWKGEDAGFAARYTGDPDPVDELVNAGADVVIAPSASPFVLGKSKRHRDILARHARRYGVHVVSVNQVGGNDDLVFEGHSCVISPGAAGAALVAAARGFEPDLVIHEIASGGSAPPAPLADPALSAAPESLLWKALVLGVRDYCRKTGFRTALLGISGGIDSALVACIGVAALGPRNVTGVAMPGPYSSEHSKRDAFALADRLGIARATVPIARPMEGFRGALDPVFKELGLSTLGQTLPDLTEENLQSRLRGTALMALSNRTGAIVLTTGNKSELAVGYCTLYGDMNGGLAVLSDVTKQQVYALSRWINANHRECGFDSPPIPEASITKAPSAELRPNQTDQDSLPPYDVLDAIIERYVELRQGPQTIAREAGFEPALVAKVARMIDISEYKRKQAAVGIKVTSVAFGSGRRVPIAQRWTGR